MIGDTTRTLLFGVFVVARRKLTASQVIELAKPLNISPTNVKSHLTRMVADGALRRSGPARQRQYWPSETQTIVMKGIAERLNGNHSEAWDGSWLMLTLQMPSNRAQRERLKVTLWFDGFRPCAPSTFVRPAWPKHWALRRAEMHLARARGLCVCGSHLGSIEIDAVSAIYGLDRLDLEAHRLAQRIANSRISMGSGAAAFATRMKIGGLVARLVGHDPRLPPALWGKRRGMHELVRAFRQFEKRIAPMSQDFLNEIIQ